MSIVVCFAVYALTAVAGDLPVAASCSEWLTPYGAGQFCADATKLLDVRACFVDDGIVIVEVAPSGGSDGE